MSVNKYNLVEACGHEDIPGHEVILNSTMVFLVRIGKFWKFWNKIVLCDINIVQ